MRLVSPVLKRVVYPLLSSAGYFRRRARNGELCVITYHGVRPAGYASIDAALDGSLVAAQALREQLRLLKANYTVISPETFLDWLQGGTPLPERAVLLTCDDGLQNTLTDMLPVLQEQGVSCLFFVTGASAAVTPGMLWYEELHLMLREVPPGPVVIRDGDSAWSCASGANRQAFWWNLVRELSKRDAPARAAFLQNVRQTFGLGEDWIDRYRQDAAKFRRFFLLGVKDVQHLQAQAMSIGAHTLSHPMLSQVSENSARSEIVGSRTLLESVLAREVRAFAYPFGNAESVTERDLALAESAGFTCAFLNVGGGFGAELPRFAMPRVHVTADMALGEFEAHVSGFYRNLRGTQAISSSGDCA
jgi:peptidoglycan/xylan/chitin deacetylase (PgdA/CDA1 family)